MTSFPRPATPGDCCAGAATGALAVVAHGEGNGARPDVGPVALPVLRLRAAGPAGRERGPAQLPLLVGAGQLATRTC
jgi:hypothetical protein